jgi:hypothetical protein
MSGVSSPVRVGGELASARVRCRIRVAARRVVSHARQSHDVEEAAAAGHMPGRDTCQWPARTRRCAGRAKSAKTSIVNCSPGQRRYPKPNGAYPA